MRRALLIVASALLCTLSICMSSRPAQACSCQPPANATIALSASHTVFEGQLLQSNPEDAQAGAPPPLMPGPTLYRFKVLRSWKGKHDELVTVRTPGSAASCGRSYDKTGTYLVYASLDSDGLLFDNLCSRTRKTADAQPDLLILDAAAIPEPGAAETKPAAAANSETSQEASSDPAGSEPPAPGEPGCSLASPDASFQHTAPWLLSALLAAVVGVRRKRD